MTNFLNSFFDLFRSTSAASKFPADSLTEPAQITQSKVLLIVYDPVMDKASGTTLSQSQKWYRVSDLITGFMADMLEVTAGLVRYQIVERVDLDEFPAKTDGFRYTPQTYLDVLTRKSTPHMPQEADYTAILTKYNILQRVARNDQASRAATNEVVQGVIWLLSDLGTDTTG